SLLGAPEPLAIPAARLSRIEAGGVLVMKVNERSLYTVITTGMISPSISFWVVRALNCLQNSIMLICAWPSAGPTGGAGVALPAAICNFTKPVTFFAIISLQANIPAHDLLDEFIPAQSASIIVGVSLFGTGSAASPRPSML